MTALPTVPAGTPVELAAQIRTLLDAAAEGIVVDAAPFFDAANRTVVELIFAHDVAQVDAWIRALAPLVRHAESELPLQDPADAMMSRCTSIAEVCDHATAVRDRPPAIVADDQLELIVVDEISALARTSSTRPAAASEAALVPWAIDLRDGAIVIAGNEVHPVVARDIYVRLGTLLDEADRAVDHEDWLRLGRDLDAWFRYARPARGRSLQKPSSPVEGMAYREAEGRAIMRMATYSIAVLKPRSKKGGAPWEGAVYTLRPTLTGHDRRLAGFSIRVAAEQIDAAPMADPETGSVRPALPGPVDAPRNPPRRPIPAPSQSPAVPAWLAERWKTIREEHARILACVAPGESVTLDELAAQSGLGRELLRSHIGTLVEQAVLVEVTPSTWRRLRVRRRRGSKAPPLGIAAAPVPVAPPEPRRSAAAPKRGRSSKAVQVSPPAPPPLPLASCRACNTAARTLSALCVRCGAPYG